MDRIETNTIIVGAGPIGLEMAIALQEVGIMPIILEAGQVGEWIRHWPPNTHFFSSTEHVALAGVPVQNHDQQAITGEEYLIYLRMLVEMFNLQLHVYEPVHAITPQADGSFFVTTNHRKGERCYHAQRVIMAHGGMSAPRMLNISGEQLPHVHHYFKGPHHYFRTKVLVVGGRNSAVEAALRCWRVGCEVVMSYRRPDFQYERIKPHLADDLATRIRKGEITFYPATVPVEITPEVTKLASCHEDFSLSDQITELDVDFVVLATGFVADMRLLTEAGVTLEGEAQAPTHDPETLETNVKGLYVAGTAVGGTQSKKFKYFISTTHDHVSKIAYHLTGKMPTRVGTVEARNNAVTWKEVQLN